MITIRSRDGTYILPFITKIKIPKMSINVKFIICVYEIYFNIMRYI